MSTEPTQEAAFFSTIRSWGVVRSEQRVFGGVLGGVGAKIGMAPAPARIIFVVIALITSGIALLAYAAAWALLPDAEGRIIIQDFGRGRPNVGALVAIAIIALVGFGNVGHFGLGDLFDWGYGENTGWFGFDNMGPIGSLFRVFAVLAAILIPLAIVAGVVVLIVWAVRSSKENDRAAQGYARLPDGSLPEAPIPTDAAEPAPEPADAPEQATADVVDQATEPALVPVAVVTASPESIQVTAPYAPPAPPVYSAPPAPPRPRVPGPGKMGYLMALAWIPITAAITLYLATEDKLAVFPGLAAGVIWVAGLGLILVITALRGRKLGFLGFVSVMALIPVALSIGFATDIREQYADGSAWRGWVHDEFGPSFEAEPEPSAIYSEPPAFDPTAAFDDYQAVWIAGQCSDGDFGPVPDATGNVSLAEVSGPTTLTIATDVTRVVIPRGTNLAIVAPDNADYDPYVGVTWVDRDVSCSMPAGVTNLVTLTNPDAPLLTLELGDQSNTGQFDIYIEEK